MASIAKKFNPDAEPLIASSSKALVESTSVKKPTEADRIREAELINREQRRLINLSKSLFPIVSALITHPGQNAGATEKSVAINKMSNLAIKSSTMMIDVMASNMKDVAWINANSFRFCAGIIAKEWEETGDFNAVESLFTPEFFEKIKQGMMGADDRTKAFLDSACMTIPVRNESDAIGHIRMSLSKAFVPLSIMIDSFSFWKDRLGESEKEAFKSSLFNKLADVAADNANRVADQNGIEAQNRIYLWQGTINRVFDFASETYQNLKNSALNEVDDAKASNQSTSGIRKKWAVTPIDVDIVRSADNSIRLLDGIVNRYILSIDTPQETSKRMEIKP